MSLRVLIGEKISKEMLNFPDDDIEKIKTFIEHINKKGFSNLPGRNKPSHEVCHNDIQWINKVRYAQEHKLWHYHIGIPCYNTSNKFGDQTSEYIIHYVKGDGYIKIVDFSSHPPFNLPRKEYLI